MPRYVEAHFIEAAKRVGLRVEPRADGLWRVEHVLADLRSDRLGAVKKLGKADSTYRKLAFHKEVLERDEHLDAVLLGPGHALYAAVDERLNEQLVAVNGSQAFFLDPLAPSPYRLHFFEIAIKGQDTHGHEVPLHGEVVAVRDDAGVLQMVPADCLLDLAAHPQPPANVEPIAHDHAANFVKTGYQLERRNLCHQERKHFASTVREYLTKSFEARIKRAQNRYMELMGELGTRPEYKLAAEEAKKYIDDLERTRRERLAALQRLEIARTGPIRHLATALVLSPTGDLERQLGQLGREHDVELRMRKERTAEDIVIARLVAEGFPREQIERVGHLKLGFDIRAHRVADPATGQIEVRRIEVKGYTRGCNIQMTTNEWYKAQQLAATYWLAVVWNPLEHDNELVQIQNPAERLDHAKREITVAKMFEIPADAIVGHPGVTT
jgi:hypothetical protein